MKFASLRMMTPLAASLLLVAAALPVSIALLNISLVVLTTCLLWRVNESKDRRMVLDAWRSEPALIAVVLYCAAGLVASVAGIDPIHSLRDNAKDLHRLWVLAVLVGAFRLETPPLVWPTLGTSFLLMSLTGIGQVVHHTLFVRLPKHPMLRAHAFVHPVTYGQQLALCLLGAASLALRPIAAVRSRPLVAFTAVTGAAMLLCQTRSALLAIAAGFAVLAAADDRARRWLPWLFVSLAASAVLWERLPTGGRSLFELTRGLDPRHNPNQTRYALWSVALAIFREHPLTGCGPGHYKTLFSSHWTQPLDKELSWGSAHSLYLHQLAERGLLGLIALIGVLATLAIEAWRSVRLPHATARALWALAATAAFLVMGLTETVFQNEQLSTLFLFIWVWGRADRGDHES